MQGIVVVVSILHVLDMIPCRQACLIEERSPAMIKVCSLGSCLWCPVILRQCVCCRFSEKNPSSMDMTTMIKLVFTTYDVFSLSYNVLSLKGLGHAI